MSETKKKFRIAIVGGGLGGLALAIGLHRAGVPIHVYESAHEFSEIGAGITFGSNAIKALGLIDPALLAGFRKHFKRNPPGVWMTIRLGMDLRNPVDGDDASRAGDLLYNQRDEAESGYIHRARLLEEMVNLLPAGSTSFKKTLANITELPGEKGGGVELSFVDGTTATADAVIGCDGIKGPTRSIVVGKAVPPVFTGDYVYRQLVPKEEAIKELGEERALASHLILAYETVMVHYPVENGAFINFVAIHNSGSTVWEGDAWVKPVPKEIMMEDLKGWDLPILNLMSRIETPQQWALFDCPHEHRYYRNRMCLLGDAAHAATPHNGAGAAMAMEDAYVLSQVIGRVEDPKDLEQAFQIYDAVRRPRTQRLIQNSRISGQCWQFRYDGVEDDPVKLREQLDERFRWIWYHDLEAELKAATGPS
ncbi:putative mannitol 1-phosphate dehydrogenase protein [Phaeoacremonium minimum UCRPA7]|uniref:Putative mannitol 1-phosphate dehydrogenase protein n=1 Tax=Phaeoacremonium minimum (strain UCR-PA7) TaxID=1286976 RepID=R8BKR5_PHAM7|nr:putative mannitol 1-phosphate dehydrogenase protein [Phaeoacremonium minimum UCRPA7]EON99797.1 putative mannitol 1-phosphate dehydrogenase protein [Phaeoacremonium minimum UCRPA7]